MALLLKKLFRYHWGILLLSFVYLLLTLTNLTILPIGNDEGIYLDWGMRSLAKPGYLYYSLNDGKTPLLMWFFGVFQKIFDDPLFAGRLVSVFAGLAGLLGLYKIGVTFLDKKTAIFSSLLFVITPIIFFYNRMALMEAGVATAGIWSAYYFLKFQRSNTISDALKTGIMVGIGFFIKTNAAIFLIALQKRLDLKFWDIAKCL